MKIAIIAPSPIPFLIGGAEKLFWGLHYHMNQLTPHEVELIKVPCRDQEFWLLMEGYDRCSRLDLGHFDMVISTKYPAWMVPHKNHHLYMQHTCRGLYDLYHLAGVPLEFFPTHRELEPIYKLLQEPGPDRSRLEPFFRELFRLRHLKELPPETFAYPGPLTRAVIRWLDRVAIAPGEIKSYSAISRNVALREGYFPPVGDIEIIHHPSDLKEFHSTGYDHLFIASRLEGLKRIDLLIDAFMAVDADIELRIAGTGGHEEQLKERAAKDRRIRFMGFVNDAEIIRQYAGALFVPFIPYDEDYGLITVEAMQSSKAVLTTLDSGGVNELVIDGHNGRSVAPVAEEIAAAMAMLLADRKRTIQMGQNGKASVAHISWQNTVSRLLREEPPRAARMRTAGKKGEGAAGAREDAPPAPPLRTRRKKIVGTTSFQIAPPVSGGQKRIYHLHRELARKADSVFVALSGGEISGRVSLCPGFVERAVARSQKESLHIGELQASLSASIDDIAAIDGYRLNPGFVEALSEECRDAELVIASHPYLYHAIRDRYPGRLWYEAQNVEYDLKAAILPESPERDKYLELVREVERRCASDAERILAVSDGDKARLIELYGVDEKKILIVRNGMDFRAAAANRLPAGERGRLKERLGFGSSPVALFIGSYHGPNIEALQAINRMATQCPGVLFLVLGSVCDHEEAGRAPENVKALGVLDEDEKNVLLNATDIALNPILSGSGSNLKLLEYIAYRIPVITTAYGNRGYGLKDGEHLIMAEADDFPKKIIDSLSTDLPATRRMAENALRFASSRYDWSVIAAPLLNFFS